MIKYRSHLASQARQLRYSMTRAEVMLWKRLQRKQLLGLRFNRQKPLGPYIADFYCHSAQLVIEVDGGQHYEITGLELDSHRDRFMMAPGLKVLRFSNAEVLNDMEGVLTVITQTAMEQL